MPLKISKICYNKKALNPLNDTFDESRVENQKMKAEYNLRIDAVGIYKI